MKTPTHLPITWSRHRLRENPRLGLITFALTLLLCVVVIYFLGTSAVAVALIIAFIFSLRGILLPISVLVDNYGWHKSSVLTGATSIPWEKITDITTVNGTIKLHISRKSELLGEALDPHTLDQVSKLIQAWKAGWRADPDLDFLDATESSTSPQENEDQNSRVEG